MPIDYYPTLKWQCYSTLVLFTFSFVVMVTFFAFGNALAGMFCFLAVLGLGCLMVNMWMTPYGTSRLEEAKHEYYKETNV